MYPGGKASKWVRLSAHSIGDGLGLGLFKDRVEDELMCSPVPAREPGAM